MKYLNLVRYKNLLIVVLTMLVVRYAIVALYMPLQLSFVGFCLLLAATVCITAAGYVINDYIDIDADKMNRPDKVIIDNGVSRKNAMVLYWVLTLFGCLCGGFVSYGIGRVNFTFIFLFISGILWFYSTTFSKEPILGNVVVAILVACVPLIEVLYETIPLLAMPIDALMQMNVKLNDIYVWSLGYTIFALLLTLQREMVKDIEDVEGDRTYGRNTLPIAWGIRTAQWSTGVVMVLTIILLVVVQIYKLNDVYSLIFINVGVVLPLLYSLIKLCKADEMSDYTQISTVLKLVMMMGLLYLIPNVF